MKILKIHGCSGAGKTTAVRQYMASLPGFRPIRNTVGKIEAYIDEGSKGIVLGSYENTCGGMDTVGSAAQVCALLDMYDGMGDIIFEGLLQSTYYGAMGKHSQRFGDRYIYAFLDTPIELCLERVIARRAASGRNNKFDPQLTRDKHATIEHLKDKMLSGAIGFKHRVAILKHDGDLVQQIKGLLK